MPAWHWRVRAEVNSLCWEEAVRNGVVSVLCLSVGSSGRSAVPVVLAKLARTCRALRGTCTDRLLYILQSAFHRSFGCCPEPFRLLRLSRLPLVAEDGAEQPVQSSSSA